MHQIGTGVLGPVFRTYEPARDRLVAVKAFRLDLTPEQANAFADELQQIVDAGLDHPSIVRPVAAGVEGTVAYAASEYVAAESLDIALRHYAPATLDKVLPFITQLAGAIDFARAAGVGHGALHPRDIFVSPDEARATGFGVVQALEKVGGRAPIRRPYTAPERVDGSEWGVAADVYSLAAIAYELLTARRPAGAGGAISPSDITSDHPDLVAAALAHGLAEDPRARHQSALSFAASLEAAARGERTSAREPWLAVPVVPAEPTADMRPDGATFLDIPQEPTHDLVIEPFDELERPRERELDEFQLRDEEPVSDRPPIEQSSFDEPARRERPRDEAAHEAESPHEDAREEPAGEEHVEQPPVGPAGHEFLGTMEREPLLFDVALAAEAAGEGTQPSQPESARVQERAGAVDPELPGERHPIARDFAAGTAADHDTHRFDAASSEGEPRAAGMVSRREPLPDRQRPVLLPVALTLLLGLFVGFLAGYLVGSRDREGTRQEAAAKPGATEPDTTTARPPAQSAPARPVLIPPAAHEARPAPRTSEPPRQPQPERPAPAAPVPARLAVRSTPAGAQVFVNGRRRGPTPLTIRNLAAGTYTIRLERQGYTPETRRVTVAANAARDLAVTLKRAAPERPAAPTTFIGSMYLDSRPRGATVFVDGKEVGVTPMQLPEVRAGAHAVRFELAGHRSWSTSATVVAGQVARVTGSLELQP